MTNPELLIGILLVHADGNVQTEALPVGRVVGFQLPRLAVDAHILGDCLEIPAKVKTDQHKMTFTGSWTVGNSAADDNLRP